MESVRQMEIGPGMSIVELVGCMEHCGFGARRLAEAVSIYEQMLGEEYTRFFTLSGAMVPAGLRNVVSGLIRNGHIDVLVTTGANLVHDVIESFGSHCLGNPESDDAALREEGLSRIYDVFLPDEHFIKFEELMQSILPERDRSDIGHGVLEADRLPYLRPQIHPEISLRTPCACLLSRDVRLHDRTAGLAASAE